MLIIQPLVRYADFEGRSTRAEYWQFFGAVLAVLVGLAGAAVWAKSTGEEALDVTVSLIFAFFLLSLAVPALALRVRRLHDLNRSGWWVLVALLPLLGSLALMIAALFDGTPGPNRFGPDPKGRRGLGEATVNVF